MVRASTPAKLFIPLIFHMMENSVRRLFFVFPCYLLSDENSNGAIDIEELKKCLYALDFSLGNDNDIVDLFHYCDMDENKGIEFNEFIVVLCLAYLLADPSTESHAVKNTSILFFSFQLIYINSLPSQFDSINHLCHIYSLTLSIVIQQTLNANWPQIEPTFNSIIEVFFFLDKRGDGKLRRKDVVRALNEASPKEKSPSHITRSRFSYYLSFIAL